MKKREPQWEADLQDLLQESVAEEAAQKTMSHLEDALLSLDADSLELMREFLQGGNLKALASRRKMTEAELEAWLVQSKRQLIQHLRTRCKVRQ
jgi:hypothetical protein